MANLSGSPTEAPHRLKCPEGCFPLRYRVSRQIVFVIGGMYNPVCEIAKLRLSWISASGMLRYASLVFFLAQKLPAKFASGPFQLVSS